MHKYYTTINVRSTYMFSMLLYLHYYITNHCIILNITKIVFITLQRKILFIKITVMLTPRRS